MGFVSGAPKVRSRSDLKSGEFCPGVASTWSCIGYRAFISHYCKSAGTGQWFPGSHRDSMRALAACRKGGLDLGATAYAAHLADPLPGAPMAGGPRVGGKIATLRMRPWRQHGKGVRLALMRFSSR